MKNNNYKSVYEAFFGEYIGKSISVSDDSYYIGGDYISGRFYCGKLKHVSFNDRGIVLRINDEDITVTGNTKIKIIEGES